MCILQTVKLIPALTAAENVATPLLINVVKRCAALEQTDLVLKKVGFDSRMTHRCPLIYRAASWIKRKQNQDPSKPSIGVIPNSRAPAHRLSYSERSPHSGGNASHPRETDLERPWR